MGFSLFLLFALAMLMRGVEPRDPLYMPTPANRDVVPHPSVAPITSEPSTTAAMTPSTSPVEPPLSIPLPGEEETLQPMYRPGNLIHYKEGLLLSEGLDARVLARTNQTVLYDVSPEHGDATITKSSSIPFHQRPDAGATYWDDDVLNPGGWVYVSNSEVPFGLGGVGRLKFDKDGHLIDYTMLLTETSMNCGGGRTPWNTWVSCEEVLDVGQLYQVDPSGKRPPQLMSMASEGGIWESFAYDIRNRYLPHFFVTEDHHKGCLRRFTPDVVDWSDPWQMLHGNGTTEYLMLFPNATNDGGTFQWTDNFEVAKENAFAYYQHTEGIDVFEGELFFVCKKIRQLFVLNLDNFTYYNRTTANGLFDGKPDQMQRIVGDTRDLIYFTEEGGVSAGVHARDHLGRFYSIFESPEYKSETTGLAFSPDGRFMYVAYQDVGVMYAIWRIDGLPFHATKLDVKYHDSA
eukprot:CAMPEP_0178760534 /NCGR_PEP_ID=MMETSP0744-20121128/15540_1 /TAXON_ID=913974 /ORGANISM="Nitzschia punctata, Strain CCMP561" /LENGTH=459 /DNA_ID=CAMNT_0020415111 /DNA_START=32 /DNA_END=1411 /DNA_ORIENTATION=+